MQTFVLCLKQAGFQEIARFQLAPEFGLMVAASLSFGPEGAIIDKVVDRQRRLSQLSIDLYHA